MSSKLYADKYIELNVQQIIEIGADEYIVRKKDEDFYLILCHSGSMDVSLQNDVYNLSEKDIMLVPSKNTFLVKKSQHSGLIIRFGGIAAEELMKCTDFNNNLVINDQDGRLGQYFYKIYMALHDTAYLSMKCLGLFYELLYELTKNHQNTLRNATTQEKNVEIAKEFMNQNFALEISIGDVAKKVGVTSNYLANIFNLYVHKSPKEYLTTVRMEQAKKMLSTHRYKVKEVGKFVGYKNQLHFSSEFKKYTGKSPLQYSKSNED